MKHSFNIYVAEELDVNCAILLHNIQHWVLVNKANNKNIKDGKVWTYNSVCAYQKIFFYMKPDTVRNSLKKLESAGYIEVGNYNPKKYDKTKWYAMTEKYFELEKNTLKRTKEQHMVETSGQTLKNCSSHLGELPNAFGGITKPIPDIISDINKNKKDIGKVASQPSPIVNDKNPNGVFIQKANRIIDHLNKTTKKNLKKIDANRKEIISRLKDGYQYKEFIQVINTKSKDPFFTDNPKYMRVATLFCKKNFDSYLNEDPKQYKKNSANNIGSGTGNIDFTKTQTMEEFMESSK